ncbi:MAG TPA: patatin-like phospholipase family protein [Methyloceanibacter sp.]|nr:patatin-like phospholipase family protein [Methyloceanibacter sp.]
MGEINKKLECDLVMRGGITSGIVYPRAIAELAETYNFRSIGGTSAGAIAVAGTAAAQFGVNTGHDHFQKIYRLPEKLADLKDGKSVLERLFQPQQSTRRLFRLLMSGLEREGPLAKALRIVGTGLLAYWPYAIIGAAVTLTPLLWVADAGTLGDARRAVLSIVALLLGLLTAIIGATIGVLRDVRNRLPENRYGLCSGSGDMQPDEAGVLPLTDWLHDFFQSLRGNANRRPHHLRRSLGQQGRRKRAARHRACADDDEPHARHLAALPVSRRQLGTALLRQRGVCRTLSKVRRDVDDGSRPEVQE